MKAKAGEIWQQVHRPQLQADAITTRTKSRLMLALVQQLAPIVETLAAYDQEIERLFLTHPDADLFVSLPGAGKRLAPRLLAEWGDDRTRYQDASSVQALAGTSPVAFQSGNFARAHRRYACNKVLRNAFHQFAWQSTRLEPWAVAYYQRKRQEGETHSGRRAALANHWVRLLLLPGPTGTSLMRRSFWQLGRRMLLVPPDSAFMVFSLTTRGVAKERSAHHSLILLLIEGLSRSGH